MESAHRLAKFHVFSHSATDDLHHATTSTTDLVQKGAEESNMPVHVSVLTSIFGDENITSTASRENRLQLHFALMV